MTRNIRAQNAPFNDFDRVNILEGLVVNFEWEDNVLDQCNLISPGASCSKEV